MKIGGLNYSYSIRELTGLEYAINLRNLNLANNSIGDFSPSTEISPVIPGIRDRREMEKELGLGSLERLALDFNPIGNSTANLDDLTKLLTLKSLSADYASIAILTGFHAFKGTPVHGGLEFLSLDIDAATPISNRISDLAPLGDITTLCWLSLNNHNIADTLPLIGNSGLQYVYLHNNRVGDIAPLIGQLLIDDDVVYGNSYQDSDSIIDPGLLASTGSPFKTGGWISNVRSASAFDGDYRFHLPDATGLAKATWTFDGLAPGTYEVLVTYPVHESHATNAPYIVYDGASVSPLKPAVLISQRFMPASNRMGGRDWQTLGDFISNSGTLKVVLRADADGVVVADAVRVVRVDGRKPVVIDVRGNPLNNAAYESSANAGDGWIGLAGSLIKGPRGAVDDSVTNWVQEGVYSGEPSLNPSADLNSPKFPNYLAPQNQQPGPECQEGQSEPRHFANALFSP